MGSSRKQITFDLRQDALRQYYPRKDTVQDPQFFKRAYKDIQRFMEANGFDRRQYSVYVSRAEMTTLDVVLLAKRMAERFPWLRQCIKEITATNIGVRHSLLGLLRPDAPPVQRLPTVPFAAWDNPYFPAATPGRIATQYCELLRQCYPLPQNESFRAGQIAEIVQFIQKEGRRGTNQMALAAAGFRASFRDNPVVQELASALMAELSRYNKAGRDEAQRRKPKHKQSQER